MNSKKAGRLFLTITVTDIALIFWLSFRPNFINQNLAANLVVSQMAIWIPAVFFLAVTRTNPVKFCRMRKVHGSTMLMAVLYTMLTAPLITLMNAISMLFVENEVAGIQSELLRMPFLLMFFLMAVYGPFSEELVFRGILYRSYRVHGREPFQGNPLLAILISSLLFALMHLNFNQAAYAFVVGIMLALLMEATDSFWPVFLVHLLFNGNSVCLIYLLDKLPGNLVDQAAAIDNSGYDMWLVIALYFVLAVICTPLACCVLKWMARREGREEHMKAIWSCQGIPRKRAYISVSLLVAVVICLGYMIWRG